LYLIIKLIFNKYISSKIFPKAGKVKFSNFRVFGVRSPTPLATKRGRQKLPIACYYFEFIPHFVKLNTQKIPNLNLEQRNT
jgi:hypothetical protein